MKRRHWWRSPKKTGLVNAVHFNVRCYPMVRQMKAMCNRGEVGQVFSILGSYLQNWLFLETDYNWRLEPDQSGESRAIADIGSHLMDALEYITGLRIVRAGGQPSNPTYPTFEDGLRELILCERIIESHKSQRWVTV